jgi:hypothetical protein
VFGNEGMLFSYLYIFCYLTFYRLRALWIQETTWNFLNYNILKLTSAKQIYINYFDRRMKEKKQNQEKRAKEKAKNQKK